MHLQPGSRIALVLAPFLASTTMGHSMRDMLVAREGPGPRTSCGGLTRGMFSSDLLLMGRGSDEAEIKRFVSHGRITCRC